MKKATFGDALAGTAMGLLVGLLLGLSVSSVVGSVVASLAALLAAFLGMTSSPQADGSNPRSVRVAAFALCCAGAVVFGLEARSHNWFGASPTAEVAQWTDAGYDEQSARDIVAYREVGLVPRGRTVSQKIPAPSSTNSDLFASHSESECENLSARAITSTDLRLSAFKNAGGSWSALADAAAGLEKSQLSKVLEAGYRLACTGAEK